MKNVEYRNLEKKDLETIKDLIKEAFSFHKFIHNGKLLKLMLDLYVRDSILDSSFTKVAVKDDKVIGFIFSKVKDCSNNNINFFYNLNEKEMQKEVLLASDEDKKDIFEFMKIKDAYEYMLKENEEIFQGCINLFIVSKECRGLGVGKTLLNYVMEDMNNNNVEAMYLFTDTRCNYGFYDNLNFKLLAERKIYIDSIKSNITTFLYSYIF